MSELNNNDSKIYSKILSDLVDLNRRLDLIENPDTKNSGGKLGSGQLQKEKKSKSFTIQAVGAAIIIFVFFFLLENFRQYFSTEVIIILYGTVLSSAIIFFLRKGFLSKEKISRLESDKLNLENNLDEARIELDSKVERKMKELSEINKLLNSEIESRKKTEEALRLSEKRYRLIYHHSPLAIFHFDENLIITDFNHKFVDLLNLPREDLLYYNFNDFSDLRILPCLNTALEGKEGKYEGSFSPGCDQNEISVSLFTAPYFNEYHEVKGGIGIIEDINERRIAEETLIKAKEEAEQSDRLKSEFLAQVSHEIRTPIHSIVSFSSLLQNELENIVDDELKDSFSIMGNAGRRIIRTMDLILNMAEVQTGTYDFSPKFFDIYDDILYGLHKEFSKSANVKNLRFEINRKNDSTFIEADEYTVRKIFENLIDNAIKYTPKGKVEIIIDRNSSGKLFVEIVDTGIGISKEYFPQMFTLFSQEERGYSRKFEGNGLGLALVKKYCEINNAVIEVKTQKQVGSSFKVIFSV